MELTHPRSAAVLACVLGVLLAACTAGPAPSAGPTETVRAFSVERTNAPTMLAAGETRLVSLTLANRGNATWQAADARPTSVTYRWDGDATRPDPVSLPHDVAPGATVDVVVPVTSPTTPGSYTLVWSVADTGGDLQAAGDAPRATVDVRAPEAKASWDAMRLPDHVYADVEARVAVGLRNTGTVTWPAKGPGAVAVSYHWRDPGGNILVWDGARTTLDDTVTPDERLEPAVRLIPPKAPGRYVLELDLVRDGLGWFGGGPRVTVDVAAASYSSSLSLVKVQPKVTVGQPVDVTIALKNTGAAPWPNALDRRAKLAYHVADAGARFVVWDGARTEIGRAVGPGESVELKAVARAPETPGTYKLRFDLVQEGVGWYDRRGNVPLDVSVEVVAVDYKAVFGKVDNRSTMATGITYTVHASIQNVGESTWPKAGFDPVRLGAHWLDADGKIVSWDAARADLPKDIAPMDSISQDLQITAPDEPGAYTLVVDLVQEGVVWFASRGSEPARLEVNVAPPTFRAHFDGALPATARAGQIAHVPLTVRNDGPFDWNATGDDPVNISHHWRTAAGDLIVWDGFRTSLPHDVRPGESVDVEVWFFAPAAPGSYVLEIDAVQESVTWFADKGSAPLRANVAVVP